MNPNARNKLDAGVVKGMKNEFILAFNEVLDEKQLPKETIIRALESAMVSAYRKTVMASKAQKVEAKLDSETGNFIIYAEKEVVESVLDDRTEVVLEEARKVEPEAQIGDLVVVETTPKNFGRVAAQTARQVIQQQIRDAERQDQVSFYEKQIGDIVSGVVQSITGEGLTIGLEKKAEGLIVRKDLIRGERFRLHDRVRALVIEVKDSAKNPQIILSRTHPNFLRRLLENEVPEIFHGIVIVRAITREPGERAKIAVTATQQGIDPVGACVGLRGVRIQTIVRELHDEKIDVIEWNPDPTVFISKAISPARVIGVYLGEGKTATIVVPEDQLSLAIGRDGQNARLAAKLTGWRIDIKSIVEATSELIHIYETDGVIEIRHDDDNSVEALTKNDLFAGEDEVIESVRTILAKKTEGRNLSFEETDTMNRFVDRVEKRKAEKVHVISVANVINDLTEKGLTKEEVNAISIANSGLPTHVIDILRSAGFSTFADLYRQMKEDPGELYKHQGITASVMSDIAKLYSFIGSFDQDKTEELPVAASELPAEETFSEAVEPQQEKTEDLSIETEVSEAGQTFDETMPESQPEMVEGEIEPESAVEPETQPEMKEESAEEVSFDELFNSTKSDFSNASFYPDEEEEEESTTASGDKPQKKKKKKKGVEIEFDPDQNTTLVRRKHKRGDDDWGW